MHQILVAFGISLPSLELLVVPLSLSCFALWCCWTEWLWGVRGAWFGF